MKLKLAFCGAEDLMGAVALVASDLDIEISSEANCTVRVKRSEEHMIRVIVDDSLITVEFGGGTSVFLRALAIAVGSRRNGIKNATIEETPIFTLNGAMFDMSRNAVMKVETVKLLMRKMALMGMNAFMLYTEDTYEIDGYPYFGHMRGRYTKAELKELDAYAVSLGIELIPCIQMLGHLGTHLRWKDATRYKDGTETLRVGAEETYKLIDKMLETICECFSTKRIHVGMDETNDLGRGRALTFDGYREPSRLYMEHLTRICEMIKAHGLRPMMWSDMMMHFASVGNTAGRHGYDITLEHDENTKDKFPDGIDQVFWDYYNDCEEFYSKNIDNHREFLGDCTLFAGGVWAWSGYAPLYRRSLGFTLPALEACKTKGVKEVVATVWHNGSECSLILALAGLAWYADYGYKGYYDEKSVKQCFEFATLQSYDDFVLLEGVEEPNQDLYALSRPMLYNDPLISLAGKNLEALHNCAEYYNRLTSKILECRVDKEYAPAFDVIAKLSSLFENKADFEVRLKHAYDLGDRETLKNMKDECDLIIEKLKALRLSHRSSWMRYNKPFGWEVFDIRYGGMIMRFETCRDRLCAYLLGEIERIEELEAERLRIDCSNDPGSILGDGMLWMNYRSYVTAGIL